VNILAASGGIQGLATVTVPTQSATPSFSPAPGTYNSTQTVTIGSATPSATIYYTTNGATPTTSSSVYSGPITVSATETLSAIAIASGSSSSPVGSAVYTITPPAGTPSFSPAPGTYNTTQTVTIGTATPAATIYYTTNGSTPTTSSSVYSGPITVSATETLSAIAVAAGNSSSPVGSAAYTITPPSATPSPSFSVVLSPAAITVANGNSGTASVQVTPQNGYASTVSFSCSGLPQGASCSFSPANVTPAGQAVSTTLTVATSTTTAAIPHNSGPFFPGASLAAALCCLGWRKRRGLRLLAVLIAAGIGLGLCSGCGTNSIYPSTSTSTVTVMATGGSLQPTTSFTLTVQ